MIVRNRGRQRPKIQTVLDQDVKDAIEEIAVRHGVTMSLVAAEAVRCGLSGAEKYFSERKIKSESANVSG